MIVTRAPLRISFVGGGTDLPDFYRNYRGRVISTTIDKYVYVVVNRTPLIPKISARYSISETVNTPYELQHTRIKAALIKLGIKKGIEIASFANLPARTGLGASSSFTVALIKSLYSYLKVKLKPYEAADLSCDLEINLVGEPIGKQDQYAAAFGGLNVIEFHKNGDVKIKPLYLDFKKKAQFQDHLLLFFTGLTRDAASVLKEQKKNINIKMKTLKEMSDSVDEFIKLLFQGNFKALGSILHKAWLKKRSLASKISNPIIDNLYSVGIKHGAWGGKLLGAGGGGCILFVSAKDNKKNIATAVKNFSKKNNLKEFTQVPLKFVQSGSEILFNADH